jgi:hypothetical protein
MRRLAAILFMACLPVFRVAADESVDIFKQIYATSDSFKQKYFALSMLVDTKDPIVALLLESTLKELIDSDAAKLGGSEKDAYDALLLLTCTYLGNFLHEESKDDLMRVARMKFSAQIRAEAIISLGRIRALDYIGPIAALLADLNLKPSQDPAADEILANACIISLGKMSSLDGWPPVFYATQGWYSSKVRLVADEILPVMVDDPSPAVAVVISKDAVPLKTLALQYENRSKAPRDRKIMVSILALKAGAAAPILNASDKGAAWALRSLALQNLVTLGDSGLESVETCKLLWPLADLDEKLLILTVYGANKRNEAAVELNSIILDYNRQRNDSLVSADLDRLAKAAIQNAGRAENAKAIPALKAVSENSKWSSGVLMAAAEAMKLIIGQ